MRLLRDPKILRHFHAAAAIVFAAQIPLALFTGLKDSVPYLVFLSLWALVASHWAAWQSTRAEQEAEKPSDPTGDESLPGR